MASEPVSMKAWGQFTRADYSLEQLKAATLIHPPQPTDRKEDYKLRVREPDGTLNQNAIYAAASVLAGGRGGVNATAEQKAQAATKLLALYAQIKHTPPPSLKAMAHSDDSALAHYGVRGMRWGVRRDRSSSSVGGSERPKISSDVQRVHEIQRVVKSGGTKAISNRELQDLVTRMNLEQQYSRLKPPSAGSKATKFVASMIVGFGKQQLNQIIQEQGTKMVGQLLASSGVKVKK